MGGLDFVVVAFDGEFTGGCTKLNWMHGLGAAFVDVRTRQVVERFETFIRPQPGRVWDADTQEWARNANPAYYARYEAAMLDAATPDADAAGRAFCAWLDAGCARHAARGKMALLSDTNGSDFSWLETILPPPRCGKYLFGPRMTQTIGATSYYLGLAGVLPGDGINNSIAEKMALRKYGFSERPDDSKHNDGVEGLRALPDELRAQAHTHSPLDDAVHAGLLYAFVCHQAAAAASA